MPRLLDVQDLRTHFHTEDGVVRAVDEVTFHIEEGEVLGLVGESGCGKSVTSLSIMRLIAPPGRLAGGHIRFRDTDLAELSEPEMQKVRGNEIAMIFQEPMTSLNPVFTVGDQIAEAIMLHQNKDKRSAMAEAARLLTEVQIPDADKRVSDYPHQMSGGMRQRVMIAMALSCNPSLLIADEPTTALDVTIQAQILELILEEREKRGLSVLLITHDLGVVAEIADRVAVMYTGKIVEEGSALDVFKNAKHPYTRGLLRSVPNVAAELGAPTTPAGPRRLETIDGMVPDLLELPKGCYFEPRCTEMGSLADRCAATMPDLVSVGDDHNARCFLFD